MSGASILEQIVDATRRRLAAEPIDVDALEAGARAAPPAPDGLAALSQPGLRVIAEVKRRSPSAGAIEADADAVATARGYAGAGAAAISVLTEPQWFGGSLGDLEQVAAAVTIPCLRKDFVVGRRQILEARAAGASLVLLIVASLGDDDLTRLRLEAEALGMHALVEAHTADEVRRAAGSGARIIGVNNRDLRDLSVDLAVSERLRPLIPDGLVAVAESGVRTRADVARLRSAGYEALLVGSSLMGSGAPAEALTALLAEEAT